MNIVQPYARLLGPIGRTGEFTREDGTSLLRRIEFLGRFSHASEDMQTDDSWQRFIPAVVMQHGDWSIVEHASVTVDFLVDRGISHELVRHRLFSFTQSSTRFINYAKKMPPSFIKPPLGPSNPNITAITSEWTEEANRIWEHAVNSCEEAYRYLLGNGCTPQIARSVFPNALATRVAVTGNLRNWRHVFLLRTTKETHPQFREVMLPLLEEFKNNIPLLYDDIIPMERQIDNMRKPK